MVAWEEKGRGAASRGSRDLWGISGGKSTRSKLFLPPSQVWAEPCAFTVYWPFDSKGKRTRYKELPYMVYLGKSGHCLP